MSEEEGSGAPSDSPAREALLKQLELYLGVYKQHFDLAIKAIMVYLAGVGAAAGFMFRDGAARSHQLILTAVVVVFSAIALVAFLVSRRWVMDLEKVVGDITTSLELPRFPFSGARGICIVAIVMSAMFAVAGILFLTTL